LRKTKGIFATWQQQFSTTTNEGLTIEGQVCRDWIKGKAQVYLIKISISFLIVGFNYVLRFLIIKLVEWIGKKTISN
jgi:hypothetical protein